MRCQKGDIVDFDITNVTEKIIEKTKRNAEIIKDSFPYNEADGKYQYAKLDAWTNGFWPGLLWQVYDICGDEDLKNIARKCEEKLDAVINSNTVPGHDVGFVWLLTSGQNYKITKNEDSKRRLMQMAVCLAGRFNIAGNYIRAWDCEDGNDFFPGLAIIDCMMNLPLLLWASKTTGDPRFSHIAKAHADTVLKYFIDKDGAVRHICKFDPQTGRFLEALGGQGFSPESAWSRGASWAIYGMAMLYRYTGQSEYLDAAKKVSNYFIGQIKDDFVPAWDFRATGRDVKDTSAGAIAACGMLELSQFDETGGYYKETAIKILSALTKNYCNFSIGNEAILSGATANKAAEENVETGLIYADYYYIEAIRKLYLNKFDLPWE